MSMLMSMCSLMSKVDVVVFVVLLQQSRRREHLVPGRAARKTRGSSESAAGRLVGAARTAHTKPCVHHPFTRA